MIRHIELRDLDFLVQVEKRSEGYSTTNQDSDDFIRDKMLSFIENDEKGGFIFEEEYSIGLLLYAVAYTDKEYPWPTVYDQIPSKYLMSNRLLGVAQLWVDPNHRRKQIASQLKKHLEVFGINKGYKQIYTHTELKNKHVIDMNINLGYDIVRIGPIWDDIQRVSLLKPLTSPSLELLSQVQNGLNNLIEAENLITNIKDYRIIDIRKKDDFLEYHFEAAEHIEWDQVYKYFNVHSTEEKPIAVVCYTGQSSMQVATAMTMMGIEAYSLLDGMKPLKEKMMT